MTLSTAFGSMVAPAIYVAIGAGIFAANRVADRPIPRKLLLAYVALPFLLFSPTFILRKTVIPTDHIVMEPWLYQPAHREPFFNPNLNDIVLQLAPWQLQVDRAWRSATLPWRFPWSGCGTALAANSQSAAFSPLTMLSALVPLAAAFSLQAAIKLLAGFLGGFLFLRELDLSMEASAFGSAVLGLGLATTVWIFFPAATVACLLPLSLFFLERVLRAGGTAKNLSLLALTIFVAALGGHPETLAVTVLLLTAWSLVSPAHQTRKIGRRATILALGAMATGAGLAGFILKPEYDSIAASSRRATIVASSYVADRPWLPHAPRVPLVFASELMPTLLGDGISGHSISKKISFFDGALGYGGVVAIGAALVGLVAERRRRRAAPAIILVVSLAIASQAWPILVFTKITPLVRFLNPARFLLGASLSIGILAALGCEQMLHGPRAGRMKALGAAALALTGLAVFVLARSFRARAGIPPFVAGVGKLGWLEVLTSLSAAGCLLLARWRRWTPRLCATFLTVLAAGELLAQAGRLYRFHDSENLFPPTPLSEFLSRRSSAWRVIGIGPVLFPNSSAFVRIRDVRAHDPMEREDYSRLLCAATGANPRDYFEMVRDVESRYLDFLSVRYAVADRGTTSLGARWSRIYSGPDGTVFEDRSAEPLVSSPIRVREIPTVEDSASALVRFGMPADQIVGAVARGESLLLATPGWKPDAAETFAPLAIGDIRERPNEITFSAASSPPDRAGLALASVVQDGGWSARDERGHVLPTTLANGPFLAIAVPPDSRRIHLRYRPPGLPEGLGISLFSLAMLGLMIWKCSPPIER